MRDSARILYILKCLEEKSDEQNPVSTKQITDYLEAKGIMTNRRTIPKDIEDLIEYGIDIVTVKSRQNLYFIGERHFELPELKLLIDAVQASKFLTAKRTKSLINKLLAFASPYQAEDLKRGLCIDNFIKTKNETAYITVDCLHTAISQNKRIRFMYYDYDKNKKKTYKHGRRIYELSPWGFICDNEKYYVIGYSKTHGQKATFRIDRIAAPKLTELESLPPSKDFDISAYKNYVYEMYDGKMLDITLKCENYLMNTVIDKYGENVKTQIADDKHFYAYIKASASKMFYGWIFGLDGAVQITAPHEAVKEYQSMLNRAATVTVIKP